MILHAGLVALRVNRVWRGVLIEGPSGVGKSDLALRTIAAGFHLVADDRVLVWAEGGRLWGRAPEALSGLIEARHVGVYATKSLAFAPIVLCVRCAAATEQLERMPEPASQTLAGLAIPQIALHPLQAATPLKLRILLEQLGA